MTKEPFLTISEFAKFTGIKRDTLIFYDRIGLLSPEHRGENSYRYYTRRQLASAFLVGSMREIGIGIPEIKQYAAGRTPQKMIELFRVQEEKIAKEIEKLRRMSGVMQLYVGMAEDCLDTDFTTIQIVEREAEPIFPGPLIENVAEEVALGAFYDYAASCGIELCYPLGAIISKASLLSRTNHGAQQFFFKMPEASTGYQPAGRYVVGCLQGDYGETVRLYQRILQYIADEHLTICSDAYEVYPFNELSTHNPSEYLIQVEIMIE